ncbi:HET-domain-containing protein, partial [Lophiostoma macrostomum CBS 122681]
MAAPAEAEAFPSVFKPGATFVHKPLDRSLQQIRLISIVPEAEGPIQCTIKHVDLDADKTPDYRALSYVWGPPSDVQRIRVNDQDFVVRSNLHHFLQAFRARLFKFRGCGPYEDEIQWLWIDQICIDQAVVQERNHQVRMMSDIYKRASYVYVWLGPSDRRTEAPDPLSGTELTHFFQNPYWHRLWIVQEVMLARYIRIMCGETLLSWEELQRFCSTGLGHLPTDAAQAVPSQVIWLAEHAMLAETHSYSTLLLTFSLNECQDPRDKVYGFQGLVNPQDRMEIDYGISVVEVFLYVVAAMVRGVSHI